MTKPEDGKPAGKPTEHGDAHSVHRRSDGGVWPDGTPRDPASGPPHYGEDNRDQKKPRDHGSDWATSDLVKDVPGKGPVPVGQDQPKK